MKMGRRLAFDYGEARIGVAISDLHGILASPLTTLDARSTTLFNQILAIFAEYDPIYLAIGNPIHLSGGNSQKSKSAAKFSDLLSELTPAPIFLIDERLTTVNALRQLRASAKDAKAAKARVDEVAAVTILELALDQERNFGSINGIAI